MSLVDNLRQQRQKPQALWLQFITAYDDKRYTLYIFIEGKTDSAYYLPELRRRRKQREICQFICDGKDGVIAAYNDKRISKKITNWKNVLFFIDKDWDDLLNITSIPQSNSFFVTEYYSFENYLVTPEFELWYLISFLINLTKILTTKNQPKRAMIKIQLTNENAIEVLSGKIPYPKSLNEFLDANLS